MTVTEDIHQPTRNLSRLFISLSLLLVFFVFVFSWLSWRQEKADQIHNLQNIMELGQKAIDTYFTQLENGMLGLSRDIIATDDQIDLDHAFILVKRFKESHPELINVTFMREDGQILFTAKVPPGPEQPTLATEPSFINFRGELNQGHPLTIGQPLVGLVTNVWIIPLRFAIHNKEGKLDYFISANLPVEILQNFWKDAPFTKTAALGLMRDDGFLVSRYPVPEKLEMAKIYGTPRTGALINYLRQEKFPANGYVEGPSSLDGPNYLNAFRRLEHFPITLFIAMPNSEILTGWWDKVKVPYILTGVLLIGGFLITRWTFRREHAREKERWHSSVMLRESEDRFRKLFEQNAAIMLVIDPDTGNIIEANKAAADFYGWSIEELKQMNFQQINALPPEAVKSDMEKALSSGPKRLEFRYRRAEGSIREVEVFSSKMEIKGKVLLYSIIHDITKRKQAEEALRESEHFIKSIIHFAQDIIAFKDNNYIFRLVNPAMCNLVGKTENEIIGKTDFDIFPYESAEKYRNDDKHVIESGQSIIIEEKVSSFDGIRYVSTTKAPVLNINNACQGIVIIVRDITERKQAVMEKARLEAQNQQLQKAESLGRMAGAIAHHFNNQLYAVMGNLEMAMADLPLGVNSNENLVSAMQAAIKAADVSRLMLTYLGQTSGKHEPIDLSETCRQNLTLLQAAAPEGMILNADFPSSGPIINADAGQMQQILTNLVTNAWEATSDNRGTICLTVKTVSHEDIPASKRFPIDWQPQEIDFACLEVSDTGSGIANKDIEKIFDPFFTTKFTGRGLGLPVVMGIVKAHGGGVTVESEPRRGSVFRIFLPVSTEELPIQHDLPAISEALPTSKTHTLSKIESGGTVLLIEDEDPVRNMSKKMLTRLGYEVLEAKDGVEAVEMFLQHQDKICFVLSDLTMPRMDGWDTLAALRKLSPCIPVVLSSGYDEAQVMAGEHSEHPNAFLGKPYQLKGLRETIKRVLTNMS